MVTPASVGNSSALPEAFLTKMAVLLGDEFDEFLSSLHQPPIIGIRVNTLKVSPQAFAQIAPYKLSLVPWCSSGFTVDPSGIEPKYIPPGKHPYHTAGLFYLQDPSAMAAAEVLSPLPGEKVLDLAAAPGGKSTHLAGLMKNTGLLVANEINSRRVWDLTENLERCGVTNAIVTNESPQRLADHLGDFFDRVLLDAPCSGEGMFRKNESACKEWNAESPRRCAIRQSAILEQAARMVKTGGCMAYTTCTFSPEENEEVIVRFLENHPEFDLKMIEPLPGLLPAKPEWIALPKDHIIKRAIRIWPHHSSGEGHFIALLIKNMSLEKNNKNKLKEIYSRKVNIPKKIVLAKTALNVFATSNLNYTFEYRQIFLNGSYVYCTPEESPSMTGLKVIHPGWWLGSIHKDRFYPSHALAMGIRSDHARYTIPLHIEDQEVSKYLAGETFNNIGENYWVLVTIEGFPIGWGKRVQNVIKNYYPHGLRQTS